MYTELSTRHVIDAIRVSRAVSMAGANSVLLDVTVFRIGTVGTLTFLLQQSNDLANWDLVDGFSQAMTIGNFTHQANGIAAAFVRVLYAPLAAGTAVVAAGIQTAEL